MDIEDLKEQARKAWEEYVEALKESLDHIEIVDVDAQELLAAIQTNDEDYIFEFIKRKKEETQALRTGSEETRRLNMRP